MVLDAGRDPVTGARGARRMMPAEGVYGCVRGCGQQTSMPGICETCGSKARRAEARREFSSALDSIPEAFRWALPRAEEMAQRAHGITTKNGGRAEAGEVAEYIAVGVATGQRPFWTLRGPTGTGKTSIMCAALAALCEAAAAAWLAVPLPGSRRVASAEPAAVRVARGARFVSAVDLLPPQDRNDERPALFGVALRATVLFLDDLGKELSAREDVAATALRAAATRELIEKRWNARKPTVITCALTNDAIQRVYDGGTYRRIAQDKQVRFLDWGEK